ncbi:MAG TPA: MarR family winged helix-turn-helix transcriptional regulator [Solirubrobacteraceae bacterium]|jgi:DNA-binding MarR family transcriptional regulator|nr:MarR family winged helix-turn-helix transcriptional regulator [Solirubrobacteraceae bacterium]
MAVDHAPPCLSTNLNWLLSHVGYALATETATALAPLGLGARGFCVLATASQDEMTQGQVASMIGLDKTTMVVTVDELERAGLAERRPASTDRRARVLHVTEAGHEMVAEAQRIIEDVQESVLGALPAKERGAFMSALTTLAFGRLAEPVSCQPPLRRREPR